MKEKKVTVQFLSLVLYFCIHIAVYPCLPTGSNTSVVAITYSILNTAALEQQSHKKSTVLVVSFCGYVCISRTVIHDQ